MKIATKIAVKIDAKIAHITLTHIIFSTGIHHYSVLSPILGRPSPCIQRHWIQKEVIFQSRYAQVHLGSRYAFSRDQGRSQT